MSNKIKPLNSALPQFFLDDVEHRLEVDPLTLGGLVDLIEENPDKPIDFCFSDTSCVCNFDDGACKGNSYCFMYFFY